MVRARVSLAGFGLSFMLLGVLAPTAQADWLFPECGSLVDAVSFRGCDSAKATVAKLEIETRNPSYTDPHIGNDGSVTMEAELWSRVHLSNGAVGDWSNKFGAEGGPGDWQPTSLRARYQVTPVSLYEYTEKFQMSVVRGGREYSGPEQVSTHKGWVSSLPSRFVSIDARAADATPRAGGVNVVIRGGAIMDSPLNGSATSRVRITNIARAGAARAVRVQFTFFGVIRKSMLRVAVKAL